MNPPERTARAIPEAGDEAAVYPRRVHACAPLTPTRTLDEWLAYIRTVHFRSIDMTLDRVQAVLARFRQPPAFRIIAVAGTNGKGSCTAMLASILAAAGIRTGAYTSPHLVSFNERIVVDGRPAGDAGLREAFTYVERVRDGIPLTYFEFATLAAVRVFQQSSVEVAVMEVGMGGRLDAVNALDLRASLITNVELDHMQWLGSDRQAIGAEKSHIMRRGRAAVFNHPDPPPSVLAHAADTGARLYVAGRDYSWSIAGAGWRWRGPGGKDWMLPEPPLPGRVQIDNAAGVLTLLTGAGSGLGVERETAARGLANTRIRGRCEIVAREPLVIIDVAHNPSAIETLKTFMDANRVGGKTTAVFGMLRDRDPRIAVRALQSHVDTWCFASIEDERGQEAADVAAAVKDLARGTVHCHDSAVQAYRCALANSNSNDRILGFGSFHIAGDILEHMTRQY